MGGRRATTPWCDPTKAPSRWRGSSSSEAVRSVRWKSLSELSGPCHSCPLPQCHGWGRGAGPAARAGVTTATGKHRVSSSTARGLWRTLTAMHRALPPRTGKCHVHNEARQAFCCAHHDMSHSSKFRHTALPWWL